MEQSNVTLSDIARRAGVSQSTVSRVINKHPRISPQTSKRVFRVVEKLGYDALSIERKAKARAARHKEQALVIETLLCPLPEQSNLLALPFFSKQIEGIETHLATHDYAQNHINTWHVNESPNHSKNKRVLEQLKKAHGIIMVGNPNEQLLRSIKQINKNCVLLGSCSDDLKINTVCTDNISGGRKAANYLINHGFKRIGFIDGSRQVLAWQERKNGAKLQTDMMLGDGQFVTREALNTDTLEIARTVEGWLLSGNCPKAIILPYTESLIAIELVLAKHQMRCPEDISIVAFDDYRTEAFHIRPTVLKTHPTLAGQKACERLVQMINEKYLNKSPHHIVIPMEINEGNSVLIRTQDL